MLASSSGWQPLLNLQRQMSALAAAACSGSGMLPRHQQQQEQQQQQQQQQHPILASSGSRLLPQQHPARCCVHTDVQQQLGARTWAVRRVVLPRYKGVLVDAAGTLLVPSEDTAQVYLRFARPYGCGLTPLEVLQRFRRAYNTPWGASPLRYVGDGRPFWRHIVQQSTGCSDEALFESVYQYYARPEAWRLAPGALPALRRLRAAGLRLAVVSNFDTRLRALLVRLGVSSAFDAVVVSAEVGAEKPNPLIFEDALGRLGLSPGDAVHVGDDRRNDVWGARDAGVAAWLWGCDVTSFQQVADRVLLGKTADEE